MTVRRTWGSFLAIALIGALALGACSRRQPAEVNPIVPSIKVNRTKAPLGSALEVTYTWTVEPGAKKLDQNYWALVHFLDNQEVMLFSDDHQPEPPPSTWEAGKTYSYTRTRFVPVYPYVGEVEVRMGLYPYPGRGERPALKGEDKGFREYKVATLELLPQTENIFLVYKDGWHNPETHPENPSVERTWTKKEALVSFKNPKTDVHRLHRGRHLREVLQERARADRRRRREGRPEDPDRRARRSTSARSASRRRTSATASGWT